MCAGYTNLDTRWYAFTFKGGKAKSMGSFVPGLTSLLEGKSGKLYSMYGHMGVTRIYRITASRGKVGTAEALTDTAELQGFPSATSFKSANGLKMLKISNAGNYALLKRVKAK